MNSLNEQVRGEQAGWGSADSVNYYRAHRNQPSDLYASEKFFLPEILPQVNSALDVGCAAGGFSRIMRSFNPTLRYVGVDITPNLVEIARRDYPDCQFEVCDGINFPFSVESFDLVHCSGVLHLNSHYQEMVAAMWAQTRRYLLCDFRLTRGSAQTGEIEIRFAENEASAKLPYYVVNADELLAFLKSLTPAPMTIRAKGYARAATATARLPLDRVIMAFFLLEKGASAAPQIDLQLDE